MAGTPGGSSAVFRVAFFILILAFILLIIGIITPNWTEISVGDFIVPGTGLWKTCAEASGLGNECGRSIYEDEGWYIAVRTFECLGVACFSFVLIMTLVLLVVVNHRLARVNIYTAVLAAIFIITGTATYTFKSDLDQLGYSCWITWLSVGLLIVGIILLEYARRRDQHRQATAANADSEVISDDTSESDHVNIPMRNVIVTT